MDQHNKWVIILVILLSCEWLSAQGPPILGDKPIMLGGKSVIIKTLTEVRNTNEGTFVKAPLMVHYLPTSNTLVSVHVPFTNYKFNNGLEGSGLGDIEIMAKYQFFRKDKMGKTFRIVAKTLQTLPTGKDLRLEGIQTKQYQSYLGVVAGYETIKYGISNELGYNIGFDEDYNEFRHKLSFGLPLLKPTYPVNQINLYFEYQNSWFPETNNFAILYGQGIQYAKGRFTIEMAVQAPLIQNLAEEKERKYSLFFGSRYVF